MAQTKELETAGAIGDTRRPPRINRVLLVIISVAALWLLAMTGSIWRSEVPQAGWKAVVLLAVGLLFLGGWALALWGKAQRGR
jgi:hypothetical protein